MTAAGAAALTVLNVEGNPGSASLPAEVLAALRITLGETQRKLFTEELRFATKCN
jgi:hypothetical protein